MTKTYVLITSDEDAGERHYSGVVGVVTVSADKMAEYLRVLSAVNPGSKWHAEAVRVLTLTEPEPFPQLGESVALPSYAAFSDCAGCSTAIRWLPSQSRWEHTSTATVACAPSPSNPPSSPRDRAIAP